MVDQRNTMNGKPVLFRDAGSVLNNSPEFQKKLLCDGLVLNLGDSCAFSCEYCYVEGMLKGPLGFPLDTIRRYNQKNGQSLGFRDVVIRRKDAVGLLRKQILREDGKVRKMYQNPGDKRVVFSSSIVDPAANMELLQETADACKVIFDHTALQIRLLSKSSLLAKLITDGLIAYAYRSPSANLAYWCYSADGRAEWIEEVAYRVLFPVYFIHHRFLSAHRHTWDRQPAPEPPEGTVSKESNQPLQRNASTGSVSNFGSPARRG